MTPTTPQNPIKSQCTHQETTLLASAFDSEGTSKANWLIGEGLTAAHFYDRRNAEIWKALTHCAATGTACTMENVQAILVSADKLEVAGGYAHLTLVTGQFPSSQLAAHALEEVRSAYALRRLAVLGKHIATACERGDDARTTAAEIADKLGEILTEKHREPTWREIVAEAKRSFDDDCKGNVKTTSYIRWDIGNMDKEFHPMERGEFITIAARTSCGKSSLSRQIALKSILRGESVLVHTLETGAAEYARNLAGNKATTRTRKNLQGLTPSQRRDVERAFADLAANQRVVVRTKEFDLATISATARAVKQSIGLDLWVIDYLGLISDTRQSKAGENMASAIGRVTQQLKQLAQTLECVIVCPVQINRAGIDEPGLHHLQDSGRIEQDASRVIIIHIPEKNSSGVTQMATSVEEYPWYEAKIRQAKGRNYGTASLDARFHRESATFVV